MGTISRQYTFAAGAIPTAGNWNADWDQILTLVNGQLDRSNVDSTSSDGIGVLNVNQTWTGNQTHTGTTQLSNTLTVGVDGTGHDVKMFGDTAGKYLLWDEGEDTLQLVDNTNLTFGTGADADIFYDGTDLNISPAVVGSGDIVVNGASMEFADSEGVTFGTGKDATIQYDGTNLVISPAAVGSGDVSISGGGIKLADSESLTLGTGSDATVQFDATNLVFNTAGYHSFTGGDVHIGNGQGLIVGHTAQETISAGDGSTDLVPEVQILGTTQADASLMLAAFSTTATRAAAPTVALVKSGDAAIDGTHVVVTDDEVLGSIIAYGDDGTDLESPAAAIEFAVDGTPGTGDMPGRMAFYTTTDAGETLSERMRIDNAGRVTKPTNVSFSLTMASTAPSNVTGDGTQYTVVWNSEVYDTGSNCSSGVFTAPVAGRYLLSANCQVYGWSGAGATDFTITIATSNRNYNGYTLGDISEGASNGGHCISVVADMDADDTAHVILYGGGGSKTLSMNYSAVANWFQGYLLG
ncbi:MAG TPA: hypothetical protein DIU35_17920 [Candidatus Latescibacteria bacterium]|nr:hypothetical protein [Candidatus Latescibacterota bacterium]|tara:strand:- start:533 stop:2104 length:1572 start_codon:yes stop_codon:yes gene_type:complete